MSKTISFKIALFAFLSTLICAIGNSFLGLDIVTYLTHAFAFIAYLFVAIGICQLIYGKTRLSWNLIFLIMSFALGLYCGVMVQIETNEIVLSYYALLFYLFTVVCILSAIVLVGRMIFGKPSKQTQADEKEKTAHCVNAPINSVNAGDFWTCACGHKSSGRFCNECGSAKPSASTANEPSNVIEPSGEETK